MVKNSTIINKIYNYFSPQSIEHTKKKDTTHVGRNPGPGLGQANISGMVKLMIEITMHLTHHRASHPGPQVDILPTSR
jgi:hypothetical protein